MEPPPKRFSFTIEVDIYLFREAREQEGPLPQPDVMAFRREEPVARARKAHQCASNPSDTEQQYGEKEQLLQEIYVARRHGYRIHPGAARKAASASALFSQAPQTVDIGGRRIATAVRDSPSAAQAEHASSEESTGFGGSTGVFDNVSVVTSAPEGPYDVIGDSSQSSFPRAEAPQEQTTPSTAQVAAGGAGQAVGASAAAGAPRARLG
ncbi:hypothetical protein MTO96_029635 [Rhipicephalus appendiculatus]